jgi:GT2 family glycosyltransferase
VIHILIVSWNVRELLRKCLTSLERYPSTTHAQQIIVVDNASSDDTPRMLREQFTLTHVLANENNRGFTGGNNDGLALSTQLTPAADYVLLLNPDTEVTPDALDTLARYMDVHSDVGVVAPRLLYADGSPQSSRRRFPTLMTAMFESTWLQGIAPQAMLDHYYARDLRDDEINDVDWVVGAAMFVRASAIRQIGALDEKNFFMYSEELDWCRRMKQAGWRVVWHPNATVIHHEGKSSEQVSARRMQYFNTSKVRYFRKHHGAVRANLLRFTLMAQFVWQWLKEAAKSALGHRRAMRQERMQAYQQVIRALARA